MKPIRVAIVSSLLLWIATALPAQRVQTSYDHTADFSGYKTYSWFSKTTSTPLWDQRVEDAVDSSLAAKGLTQVSFWRRLDLFAKVIRLKNVRSSSPSAMGVGAVGAEAVLGEARFATRPQQPSLTRWTRSPWRYLMETQILYSLARFVDEYPPK